MVALASNLVGSMALITKQLPVLELTLCLVEPLLVSLNNT
jgi:hypothetical protein